MLDNINAFHKRLALLSKQPRVQPISANIGKRALINELNSDLGFWQARWESYFKLQVKNEKLNVPDVEENPQIIKQGMSN